jgi:hypothetical protein
MPWGDGTGPSGQGPGSGRGLGRGRAGTHGGRPGWSGPGGAASALRAGQPRNTGWGSLSFDEMTALRCADDAVLADDSLSSQWKGRHG